MSETGQNVTPMSNVRSLQNAVREMKNAAADRADVVVEMREASRTRLEMLAQELKPVFDDVPDEDNSFDFAISSGEQPRLWIDAVAHVVMGRDRRTYRFLRDTRMGRVVLAESGEIGPVADQVTRYIAERIVERQRRIEGDIAPSVPETASRPEDERTQAPAPKRSGRWWSSFLLVLLGGFVGAVTLAIAMQERFPELEGLLGSLTALVRSVP